MCMAVTLLKGGKQDYVYQCFSSIYTVNSNMTCNCGTFCSPTALNKMQHSHNYGQVWDEMLICLLYFDLGLNLTAITRYWPVTTICYKTMCLLSQKRGPVFERCIREMYLSTTPFCPFHHIPILHDTKLCNYCSWMYRDNGKHRGDIKREEKLLGQKWTFIPKAKTFNGFQCIKPESLLYSQGVSVAWQCITKYPETKQIHAGRLSSCALTMFWLPG